MLKINYEVKKLNLKAPNPVDRLTGGMVIEEGCADTAFFVCEVLRDMLRDLQEVMDPNQYEEVYATIKRGDLL